MFVFFENRVFAIFLIPEFFKFVHHQRKRGKEVSVESLKDNIWKKKN